MADLHIEVDENFKITRPNLGDAEVRTIEFQDSELMVGILDGLSGRPYKLRMVGVEYFYMSSNHMQNVIDAAYLFNSVGSFKRHYEGKARFEADYRRVIKSTSNLRTSVFSIEPIAGPTMFIFMGNVIIEI